jgi:Protein of unknown function (DUF3455)
MQKNHLYLILATVLSSTFQAIAQSPTDPPPSQHPVLTVTGKGVQIYTCQQTASSVQWVFQAPEAKLVDTTGHVVGTHGAGPIWRSLDGSSVKGELMQKSNSPEPSAIPWLLLKAAGASGSGSMTQVEFIRRSETHGGNAPAIGCDAQHIGTISRVPYTATYTFYSAKP